MTALRYTLAATAATFGLLAGSPSAEAGQWDYVGFLDDNGVSYSTVSGVVELGTKACHHLRDGGHFQDVMHVLVGPLGYAEAEGAVIIAGAVSYMCPDTESAVRQQVGARTSGPTGDRVV